MGDNSGRKVKSVTPTKLLHEEPTVPERNLLQVTREMELDPQVVAKLGTDAWDPNDLTKIQRKKLDDYMNTLKIKLARLTNQR
jgi:hypothetical protein